MPFKTPLYEIPLPSTDFSDDPTLCGAVLRFQYFREDKQYIGGIRFKGVLATRTRAERCCKVWHIEDVYDTLVEIVESSWVEEMRAETAEQWRSEWETHHYMIYLDSAGCFEVIASSWEVLPEEAGSWDGTRKS